MRVNTSTQGVVGGTGDPMMQMKFVANEQDVTTGEKIVTSGMDKIFPRDIPIGTVLEAKPGQPPFKKIRVQPAAKLDQLEAVIVLLTQEPVEFKSDTQNTQTGATNSGAGAANPAQSPTVGEKP